MTHRLFTFYRKGQLSPAKLSRVRQTEARQQKKQKRKAGEGKLHVKRQEMERAKVHYIASVVFCRLLDYGCGQTILVSTRARDPGYATMMDVQPKPKGRGRKKPRWKDGNETPIVFEASPSFIHGEMRGYQLQGLNWMVSLHHNGPNGILADEMACEFKQWTPEIVANRLIPQDFEVCITSYEICLIDKSAFKQFSFEYIVIDEAHRIKNVDSILSQIVHSFSSRGRLLKELFALLNFICLEIFMEYADLVSFLHKDGTGSEEEAEKSKMAKKALNFNLLCGRSGPEPSSNLFDPALAQLQERELAVHKRLNEITAPLREPLGPEDTPEKLDAECQAAQDFIDNAEPLTDEEQAQKEAYLEDSFPDWSRRDFQQLIRALEVNRRLLCWMDDYDLLATDIQEKTPKEVKKYYLVSRSGSNSQARICYPLISDYLADMFLLLPEYPRIEQLPQLRLYSTTANGNVGRFI
ncbi:hypothetical protein PILCRDRAFT_89952 [Piloderma croceum F 1598]|uniref:Helicase ATP-binding domain-containing protein n=1 Tax=Piloderma croceum (strain F 1598) TaxID=765440 RepID=A0A0C3BRD0_PILCF|nr:hypothetical protein PILCRDRAFT_89952 [Piloderma croceum F 1598]